MQKLKFYDMKNKEKFESADYKLEKIKGRNFAITEHKGGKCYRIVSADFRG